MKTITGLLGLVFLVLAYVSFGEYIKSNAQTIFAVWIHPVITILLAAIGLILLVQAKWIEK